LTINLANLNRFLQFLYHFNLEEILHATVVKFFTSPDLCAHLTLPAEIKSYIFAVVHKTYSSVHVTATLSNLTDFNNFCTAETEKMYKTGHAFFKLLLKESVANDV